MRIIHFYFGMKLTLAILSFVKASDAINAIRTLDSTYPLTFEGRRLHLSQARPRLIPRAEDGSQKFDSGPAIPESLVKANEIINKDGAAKIEKANKRTEASRSPKHMQFSKANSFRSSPTKTSKNSASYKRSNEESPSKKTAIVNEESRYGRGYFTQRVYVSPSSTNLPSSNSMERQTKPTDRIRLIFHKASKRV